MKAKRTDTSKKAWQSISLGILLIILGLFSILSTCHFGIARIPFYLDYIITVFGFLKIIQGLMQMSKKRNAKT